MVKQCEDGLPPLGQGPPERNAGERVQTASKYGKRNGLGKTIILLVKTTQSEKRL